MTTERRALEGRSGEVLTPRPPMRATIALLVLSLLAPALAAQSGAPLVVVAPDGRETTLTAESIAALARVDGQATAHGHAFAYAGPTLREVLRLAGVQTDSLRGPQLRRVVKVVAADGYAVVLALSDLDPSIGARRVILVDAEDGRPLPADYAPRRLIIEGDVRPSRWVRQVVRLVVLDVP